MLLALRSSRDLRLLVLGELISRSGSAASFIAVWSVGVYEFGVGPGALSLLALCNTVPRVIASAVAGRMVDRVGPRDVLIAANVVGLAGSLAQFVAPSPVLLGLASVVAGIGFGAFMPAIGSMTPRVVDEEHLLPANAMLELTWQVGFVFGPLAGALAIAAGGTRAPLLFDVATFVGAIACIAPIRLRPAPAAEAGSDGTGDGAASPARRSVIDGIRYVWSIPVARFVLVLNTGGWISISFFIVLEPLYVEEVLGMGPTVLGLLQTAFGLGAILGAWLAARAEARVTPVLVALTIAICGSGMILYTATASIVVATAGVAWWGVGLGLWAPFARTMIHRGVPIDHHGRVNGVLSSVQSGMEVLPVLAAGQLAALVGIQVTLVGAGVGSLLFAGWGVLTAGAVSLASVRGEGATPHDGVEAGGGAVLDSPTPVP